MVDAIRSAGGEAIANGEDVADFKGAERLVKSAIDQFGGLDVVVNNAGFLRDRMFFSCSEEEWDAVLDVNLKGAFNCMKAVTRQSTTSKGAALGPPGAFRRP